MREVGLRRHVFSHGLGRTMRMAAIAQREQAFVVREAPNLPYLVQLKRFGVATLRVGDLPPDSTLLWKQAMSALVARASDQNIFEAEDVFAMLPEAFLFGLERSMLDLAENYIGQPCRYAACALKRERVGAPRVAQRLWHRDVEDERMLRVLIYLSDVSEGDGGLQYCVSNEISSRPLSSGYFTDEQLTQRMSNFNIETVTGKAGTVVLFDGARLTHRAGTPTRTDRLSLCFTYTSRHPLQSFRSSRLTNGSRRIIGDLVGSRAGAYLH